MNHQSYELHKPAKGSFWEGKFGVHYVIQGDLIIGKVSMVARNRFKWCRYTRPLKVTTTAKVEPPIAETHYVPRKHQAIWAVKVSYANASKGQ